jgi:anti-sigma factor RsiW
MDASPDCLLIQSQLQLHAGLDLSPEEGDAVEQHLVRCSTCAALSARARASRQRLAAAAVAPAVVDAVARAAARVRADAGAAAPNLWERLAPQLRQEGLIHGAEAPVAVSAAALPVARGKLLSWRSLALASGLAAAALLGAWWVRRSVEPAPATLGAPVSNANGDLADASAPVPDAEQPSTLVADDATPRGGLRRMRPDERPFSDFAQDPAALRRMPVGRGLLPDDGAAAAASQRELR